MNTKLKSHIARNWNRLCKNTITHLNLPRFLAGKRSANPILIAGLPRSGSSWLGRLFIKQGECYYIHEPFNPDYCSVCNRFDPVRLNSFCDPATKHMITMILKNRFYHFVSMPYQPPSRFYSAERTVVKDVHVLFSMEYLQPSLWDIILLIRHPCAYAESHLRRDLHPPAKNQLKALHRASRESPIVNQLVSRLNPVPSTLSPAMNLGLYWSLAYTYSLEALKKHEHLTIRYEDFASNPLTSLRAIIEQLRLSVTSKLSAAVQETTQPSKFTYTKRDPNLLVNQWRSRLDDEIKAEVIEGVDLLKDNAFDLLYRKESTSGSGEDSRETSMQPAES